MSMTTPWQVLLMVAPLLFLGCGIGDRDVDEPGGGANVPEPGGGQSPDAAVGAGGSGGGAGGAAGEGALVINEFLASNDTGLTDEAGEFEDWIEFYNGTANEIDLGGYSVTDTPAEPTLSVIPADTGETVIPAGGYLVMFGDKTPEAGALHLNLKLSDSGESIALYDPAGNLVDEYTYDAQTSDQTTGRSPNGTGDFCPMSANTPGAANAGCL